MPLKNWPSLFVGSPFASNNGCHIFSITVSSSSVLVLRIGLGFLAESFLSPYRLPISSFAPVPVRLLCLVIFFPSSSLPSGVGVMRARFFCSADAATGAEGGGGNCGMKPCCCCCCGRGACGPFMANSARRLSITWLRTWSVICFIRSGETSFAADDWTKALFTASAMGCEACWGKPGGPRGAGAPPTLLPAGFEKAGEVESAWTWFADAAFALEPS